MKFLKVMVIVMALVMAAGIGIYMCTDSKETENVEEAVLI
jgi:membrane protein insertase Oxa1/YidC/SpoIIIJ